MHGPMCQWSVFPFSYSLAPLTASSRSQQPLILQATVSEHHLHHHLVSEGWFTDHVNVLDSLLRFGPEGEGDGARVPELLPVPQVLFGRRPDLLVILLLRRSKRCQERRGGSYVSRRTAGLAALHAVLADHVASEHVIIHDDHCPPSVHFSNCFRG